MNLVGKFGYLYTKELHSLYRECSVVGIGKCTRLRWAGHVVGKGREGTLTEF